MSLSLLCILFGIDCPELPEPVNADAVVGSSQFPNPDQLSTELLDYVKSLDALKRKPTVDELRKLQKMLTEEELHAPALIITNMIQPRLAAAGTWADLSALYRQQARLHQAIATDLIRRAEGQADQPIGADL